MELSIYLKSGAVIEVAVEDYGFTNATGNTEFCWTNAVSYLPSLAYLKLEDVSAIVKMDDDENPQLMPDSDRFGNWTYGEIGGEQFEFNGSLSEAIDNAIELSIPSDEVISLYNSYNNECIYLIYGGMIYSQD